MDDQPVAKMTRRSVTAILLLVIVFLVIAVAAQGAIIWWGFTSYSKWDIAETEAEAEVYDGTTRLLSDAAAHNLSPGNHGLSDSHIVILDERMTRPDAVRIIGIVDPTTPSAIIDYAAVIELATDDSALGEYYTVAWGWRDDELVLLPYDSTFFLEADK